MSPDRAAFAFVGAFVDELARAGVRHVCVSPGSRSTPLALMIANHPDLQSWVHLDERCGAFFALGMARALGKPVALVCTSGTAAANFFPAIVEANAGGVPLIVLTADRPPELREVGAGQTIDQNRLYGSHTKWFVEVALPEATPGLLRYARTLAARAAATANALPRGPVHLNFPFREPLVPVAVETPSGLSADDVLAWEGRPDNAPWVSDTSGSMTVDSSAVERIVAQLVEAERPVIVCGPQADEQLPAELSVLAQFIDAPILADPLSQLRWGSHGRGAVIDRYDAFIRHPESAAALSPDVILRIGSVPTSKALFQWIEKQSGARLIVVDPARWPDPSLRAVEILHADPRLLCRALIDTVSARPADRPHSAWLSRWKAANATASTALSDFMGSLTERFEGAALASIVACLPEKATLFVSSSMPVRDLDTFAEGDGRSIRVIANRGANGIDGVVSSALGVATALRDEDAGPVVLAIGDIAFYHDMNGLLAARLHSIDATIVVINNDGGGIFSFLPQAEKGDHFEKLFGTPHGLDFAPVGLLYNATYSLAEDVEALGTLMQKGTRAKGLHIIEFRTDRARNVILHREATAAVAGALTQAMN